jgi:hypothetical protein
MTVLGGLFAPLQGFQPFRHLHFQKPKTGFRGLKFMGHFDPEWGYLVPELSMALSQLRGDSHTQPLP